MRLPQRVAGVFTLGRVFAKYFRAVGKGFPIVPKTVRFKSNGFRYDWETLSSPTNPIVILRPQLVSKSALARHIPPSSENENTVGGQLFQRS